MSRGARLTLALGAMAAASLGLPSAALAHVGEAPPPADAFAILLAWRFDPPVVIPVVLTAWAYLGLARSVGRAHPTNPWPRRRTAYFLGGLATVLLALVSPIEILSDALLTVHMVQHMLLMVVAPPLFAASGIGTLLLRASRPALRGRLLLPLLHGRLGLLLYPPLGWLAFTAALWGSHLTELYNLALLDDGVHAVEHLLYIAAATLFWWPIFSPDPLRWRLHPSLRLVLVATQLPPVSFLGVILMSAGHVLYPAYLGRAASYGIDALADQRAAGALMWVMGDMMLIGAAMLVVADWMRVADREAERVDARLDRQHRDASQ